MATVRIGGRGRRGSGPARVVQVDLELVASELVAGFRDVPLGPHRFSVRSEAGWHHEWCHVAREDDAVVVGGEAGGGGSGGDTAGLAPFPGGQHERWSTLTANLRRHWDVWGASEGGSGAGGSGSGAGGSGSGAGGSGSGSGAGGSGSGAGGSGSGAGGSGSGSGADGSGASRRDSSVGSLLADLEQSFLDGYLTPDTGDLAAMSHWRRLVATLAGAHTGDISRSPDLYVRAVEALRAQLELLGADPLDDGLRYELDFLAVELVRADDPTLGLAGITLERMLHR